MLYKITLRLINSGEFDPHQVILNWWSSGMNCPRIVGRCICYNSMIGGLIPNGMREVEELEGVSETEL